jgi:virginiamycin B lyase
MAYSRLLWAVIAATALTFTSVTGVIAQTITEFPVPIPKPNIGSSPTGITAGPDGNVWFTDGGNLNLQTSPPTVLSIGQITPTGAIKQFSLSAQPFQGAFGYCNGSGRRSVVWRR